MILNKKTTTFKFFLFQHPIGSLSHVILSLIKLNSLFILSNQMFILVNLKNTSQSPIYHK